MATTTIRVTERTHDLLRALAAASGEPMARVVERALERLRADEFFAAVDAAYGELRAEPGAWAEETEERRAWEATLGDGLEAD